MARKAELADAFDMLVDELLDAATNGAQKDLKAHVGLTEILSPEKTDAVGSLLGDYLWEDIDAARPAFDAASEVQHSSRLRTRAIGRLLERVLEHGPLHQHSAQVRFLLERQDQLSDAQATQLGEQLVQAVIDYPQQVEVLAPLLAPLEQQSPRIRDDWTRRLILHERGQPQLSQREVLLRNLQALAGRRNSNAAIAVGERLEEMKRGGDAEKELAEKLLNEW
jgi:hypothetical protein